MLKKCIYVFKTCKLKLKYSKALIMKGVQFLGTNVHIVIESGGKIHFGRKNCLDNACHLMAANDGMMNIGNHVYFNRNCIVVCHNSIEIEDNCMFGPNVLIYDHDHIFNSNGVEPYKFTTGKIVIEKNCWIGAGSIILKNTHIGEGSVIGAGTIVKGNIPPHSLVISERSMIIKPLSDFK